MVCFAMVTSLITLMIALPMAGAFTSQVNLHSPRISRPVEKSIGHFSSRSDENVPQMFLCPPVRNDLEEFFSNEKLKPPPQRFYNDLDNPSDKLVAFLQLHESRVAYDAASDTVKACLLYAAAHFREDDPDVELLNDSEWGELFHSILNNENSQEVMQSIMAEETESRLTSKNKSGIIQGEKILNKWRRRVWIDQSIIGIIQRPLRRILRGSPRAAMWGNRFQRELSRWRPSCTSVATNRFDPPIQLSQPGTYSYLSAVILFLAYNEKFHSPPLTPWKVIPIDDVLSHAYSQRMIYDRIVHNRGRQCHDILRTHLVMPWSWLDLNLETRSYMDAGLYMDDWFRWDDVYIDAMRYCGALLISSFKVGSDFLESDKFFYDGKPIFKKGDADVWHAMVLAGARLDRKGRCWLLVQNSWSSKQFVEMSLDYFQACGPRVHFPMGKLELREVFKTFRQSLRWEHGINDGGDGRIRTREDLEMD